MSSKKWNPYFLSIVYVFFFSVNLRVSRCDEYQKFLALSLPNLCPYSKFCTMGPFKEFKYKKKSPCCKPCSCDLDCSAIGNCCPDFATVRNNTTSLPATTVSTPAATASCSSPIHYGYDGFETDITFIRANRGLLFYFITATCPEGYGDLEVINKCINPSKENLRDMVIVSDNRRHAFSNRYCAECHGVTVYRPWDLKMSCTQYPSKMTSVPTLAIMNQDRCLIFSEPPTMDILSAARCFPIDRWECNTTEGADPNMELACQSAMVPYTSFDLLITTTYKNPYCYMCSEEDGYEIQTVCPHDNPGPEKAGFTRYAFNAVLDITNTERAQAKITNTNANPCLPTEIYDHHFEKCRKLNCPITMVPVDGKCTQIFKSTASLSLTIGLVVNSMNEDIKTLLNKAISSDHKLFSEITETIAFDFFLDVGMHKLSCGKCISTVFSTKNNTNYILDYALQTNSKCQTADIFNSLKKFKPTRKYLSLDKKMLQSTMSAELSYKIHLDFDHVDVHSMEIVGLMYSDAPDCPGLRLEPLFYCPYLDIQQNEYSQLLMPNKKNMPHFTSVVKRNTKDNLVEILYRVCVDRYLNTGNTGGIACANRLLESVCIAIAAIVQLYVIV